ncbi:MAG: methyltransferase domain-containing protein [Ruminococcaceae bacterium]|nr:methyltransferase domain-containing protein [Oscillospiraceae bacterium]
MEKLEQMSDFFTARVVGYDEHMINDVEGCKECYKKMATLVPLQTKNLLDLGCGTGLELDEIFKILPHIAVTGIDMTQAMLDELKRKHPDKALNLICDDYFKVDFGISHYDCAVSFQTMHHFDHKSKVSLYSKICNALTDKGCYIECDYMITEQAEENFYYSELARMKKEQGLKEDEFYHYDTPCTIDNQIMLLKKAGFKTVEQVLRIENTTILVAKK